MDIEPPTRPAPYPGWTLWNRHYVELFDQCNIKYEVDDTLSELMWVEPLASLMLDKWSSSIYGNMSIYDFFVKVLT